MLIEQGMSVRILALGSLGGLAALKRGECDIAPIHLLEPETNVYNLPSCRRTCGSSRVGDACKA